MLSSFGSWTGSADRFATWSTLWRNSRPWDCYVERTMDSHTEERKGAIGRTRRPGQGVIGLCKRISKRVYRSRYGRCPQRIV